MLVENNELAEDDLGTISCQQLNHKRKMRGYLENIINYSIKQEDITEEIGTDLFDLFDKVIRRLIQEYIPILSLVYKYMISPTYPSIEKDIM